MKKKKSELARCICLLYTPSHEHFGIVPIESMYSGRPVVAVNNGGPLESIIDQKTGFLCNSDPESFANAIARLIFNRREAKEMGQVGHKHVVDNFSLEAFTDNLNSIIIDLVKPPKSTITEEETPEGPEPNKKTK